MELTRGRKFNIYAQLMDGAIKQKVQDISPWVKEGVIIDAGFGSGLLLKKLVESFPNSKFKGIDISEHFLKQARHLFKGTINVEIKNANIIEQAFSDNSIDTKIFATILHEVYSYNNYNVGFVKKTLENSYKELKRGGRVIIRDGVKPKHEKQYAWFRDDDGANDLSLDPKKLSTKALFERFSLEFRNGEGIKYTKLKNGLYRMDSSSLYEFISKKNYRENWAQEINEEFGYLSLPEYTKLLRELGFDIVSAQEYTNPWILNNWWRGYVKIFMKDKNGKLIPKSFPPTTLVIVAEKR